MRSSSTRTRGRRVSAAFAIVFAAALACAHLSAAQGSGRAAGAPPASAPFVGVWHAAGPNGLRVATLTIVPAAGGGVSGAFLGYDYDRPVDLAKPLAGERPRVAMRSGSALGAPALDGGVLAFAMQLRPVGPLPPGAPEFFDIRGEMRLTGEGSGELKLSSPKKPEPMTLVLTRE